MFIFIMLVHHIQCVCTVVLFVECIYQLPQQTIVLQSKMSSAVCVLLIILSFTKCIQMLFSVHHPLCIVVVFAASVPRQLQQSG